MTDGIIVVNKAKDMTSHDCVEIIRSAVKIKRVGHTGTLDPMATGVLPICIGKATKVADYIGAKTKEYVAGFKLGIKTDTLDITGEIIKKGKITCSPYEVEKAVMSFSGDISQIPPMYSAKKINGKKLYEIAREGKTVERKPVNVTVKEIELLENDLKSNSFLIRVLCSKGTYIRTLIDDIGEKLGCFACMTSLVRTGCGAFNINDKNVVDIYDIKKQGADKVFENIIPVDKFFEELPALTLDEINEQKFINGVLIDKRTLNFSNPEEGLLRIYNKKGCFLALAGFICDEKGAFMLRVDKSFY